MLYHAVYQLPPSVNGAYNGKARRFKSAKYKKWLLTPALELIRHKQVISCPCKITYRFWFPDKKLRDIGNYIKLLDDRLVSSGVLLDDNYKIVQEQSLMFAGIDKKEPRVELFITRL